MNFILQATKGESNNQMKNLKEEFEVGKEHQFVFLVSHQGCCEEDETARMEGDRLVRRVSQESG